MGERDLFIGFSEEERDRITTHLERLLPYLKPGGFVIVGGLAIRYHLLSRAVDYPQRPFNDLDIIVKDLSVSPSVSKDFLIYHYHPQDQFLALVDPISRTKVDIFNYQPEPRKTVKVAFGNKEIDIISIEDQLVKSVLDMQKVSSGIKVDPKQFSDARLLMQIADMKLADRLWKSNNFEGLPKSITEAIEKAEGIAKKHPEYLQKNPFRSQKPYVCKSCKSTNRFNIAPMEEIYKVLGYIE